MKTIGPFCFLLLIALGESRWRGRYGTSTWPRRQTTWWPKKTTWRPLQTTWLPQQTTWRPPTTRPTNRPTRKPTGKQTTRPWKTNPGGQIITYDGACPRGYWYCREVWHGRCFPRVFRARTYPIARQVCQDVGRGSGLVKYTGDLASFHSQEQYDFLMRLADSEPTWIGLTRNGKDQWEFSDGSPFDFVPANLGFVSPETEDTAVLNPRNGYVEDLRRRNRLQYICQLCFWEKRWPVRQFPNVTDNRSGRTCRHGVCYQLRIGSKTFDDADRNCVLYGGGHLASFHSREQYELLMEMSSGYSRVWIGANNRNGKRWMFTDGSPMDYVPKESKFDAIPRRGCGIIYRANTLEDQPCTDRRKYVCVLPYIPD